MSEDGDIDVESAEDVPDIGVEATATTIDDGMDYNDSVPVDKRAHHNALERRRRDHIKDSFYSLRDCIPSMQGEKVSRAHILNKATEYIRNMQRNGLIREGEIGSLKKKNEVLEEQVRALESARALGSTENAEEIIQAVAEKVQSRQKVQDAQQQQAKGGEQTPVVKSDGGQSAKSASAVVVSSGGGGASKPASEKSQPPGNKPSTPGNATKGTEGAAHISPNTINLLASNLKNTQNLLSVLQKSNANLPANIKSLAARVLASPLGRQAVGVDGNLPRRIVTATTVPKGSAFSSTPLPANAQKQATPTTTPPTNTSTQAKVTSHTNVPPTVSTSGGTVASIAGDSSQNPAGTVPTVDGNTTSTGEVQSSTTVTPSQPHDITPLASSQVVGTNIPPNSVAMATAATMTSPNATETNSNALSSSSTLIPPNSMASLSSQFLAAHSLLQQQGSEINGGGLGGSLSVAPGGAVPTISSELLAQVSSFLNLPTVPTATGTSVSGGESDALSNSDMCDVEGVVSETLIVQSDTDKTSKDSLKDTVPSEPEQDGPLSKKPRLEL